MTEKYYKTDEVAKKLGVSTSTVRSLIGRKKLKALRLGFRTQRVSESALNHFIHSNTK
ncbi:MAG: helix-turn-helix domain-containing protein [Candidatus Marinimicrobia bacterium]|jgi:excisionase family DNA binding protein|nr:helix-turn-helix domain-containing protein [Candidatus Neomarinimicrobiota bacterium]